ncbi:hypothetical protein D3C87_1913080 [compost metagenome]
MAFRAHSETTSWVKMGSITPSLANSSKSMQSAPGAGSRKAPQSTVVSKRTFAGILAAFDLGL